MNTYKIECKTRGAITAQVTSFIEDKTKKIKNIETGSTPNGTYYAKITYEVRHDK